jgi:uncharacterized protein YktB (UPF0637 family)
MENRELRNKISELNEDLSKALDRLREVKECYYEVEASLDEYEKENTEGEKELYTDYLEMLDLVLLVKEEAQQFKWDYEKKYKKDTEE